MDIKAPRGTSDVLPEQAVYFEFLELTAVEVFNNFGYQKIIFPVFEHTEIFQKGIGQATDIVQKEMYTFEDKSGRSLTLRPEGTASVVRSYIEHKMWNRTLPVKLFYSGPMFRYERPQSGRYREFWQLGAEALGSDDAFIDAEMIIMLMDYFRQVGLEKLELKINSMGCAKCQPVFIKEFKSFLDPKKEELCKQCQKRYALNPLRIFDCKNEECQGIFNNAPKLTDYLCQKCLEHLDILKSGLKAAEEKYILDSTLVRGFDYYTKTTFEISSPLLGAQNAIGGGGRYDGLVESYGGPSTPGLGFALGVERVVLALKAENKMISDEKASGIFVVSIDDESRTEAFKILVALRRAGFKSDMEFTGRNLRNQMKQADKRNFLYAVILGPDEIESRLVTVKNLKSSEQKKVKHDSIIEYFSNNKE